MTKYYIIEAEFSAKKWERIGERFTNLHQAVVEMERIDLTFPTRISRIVKEVVLSEIIEGKRKKNPERKNNGKSRNRKNKAHGKRVTGVS